MKNKSFVCDRLGLVAFLAVLILGMVGCAGQSEKGRADLADGPETMSLPPTTVPQETTETESADGSLWRENAPLISMFEDQKARTVGDIVTIRIIESSKAANTASTETDRSSSLSASVDAFFNAEKRFPADRPFFNPFSKVAGGLESEFEGTGATQRTGDLNAYITAKVTQVLPNGNLVVTGSREVLINNENQIIELTGIVRPRDIDAGNQVLSTYVADAKISYSGTGVINDRQKPGWLTGLVLKVWPF